MKKMIFALLMLVIPLSTAYSQNQATWEPSDPDFGDTLTITFDPSLSALIGTDAQNVKLHWGINEGSHGDWNPPPETIWPEGSVLWNDAKAIQSPMVKTEDGKWTLVIATEDTIRTIHFVVTDGTHWDNNSGSNWDVYFGGLGPPPKVHSHTVTLEILVDMSQAIRTRGFSYGDTLEMQCGFFDTASEVFIIPLERQGFSSVYAGSDTIRTTLQDTLDYSYFAIKNGTRNWEVFFNFDYHDPTNSEAQRRRIKLRRWTQAVVDTAKNNTDPHRVPFFRNLNVLARDVLVTLECDVRPAYYHLMLGGDPLEDIQPGGSGDGLTIINPEEVLDLGLAVNGPITGSWSNDVGPDWGAHLMDLDNKRMYDDGTHGDAFAGDTIFTAQFQFYKDSADVVGQEFKFGIGGGDNESGFGNNHVENIDDFEPTATIEAQFGSIYPVFYSEWDYDNRTITSVEFEHGSPYTHILNQNYPNPFNPGTTLKFTLPKAEKVSLRIYNARGEVIASLLDHRMPAGSHTVSWNGLSDYGQQVSTGIYLCRFQAGKFTKTMKMMMMK
ncbi:T9SS type A sorting domain-containing protein [bacterium]|nr:T9SS type A sorting domain-containing protein [bacterium]